MNGEIDSNKIIVGDLNTPLTSMDRSPRQKINKKTKALKNTLVQMDFTDIYKTFHQKIRQFMFFSSTHRTVSRRDHILVHKTSFSKLRRLKS